MKLSLLPRRLLCAGSAFAGSAADAQRVQLVNALILVAIAISLIVRPYTLVSDDAHGSQINLATIVWFGIAYWLNASGRPWSAAVLVSLATPITTAAQMVLGGIHGGAQFYLLPSALLPFLTFSSSATRTAIMASVASALMFVATLVYSHGSVEYMAALLEPGPRAELNHSAIAVIVCMLGFYTMRLMRISEEAMEREQRKSETLLLDLFPRQIARRLQRGQRIRAERHGDASVLFCRVIGLDADSDQSPEAALLTLSALFAVLDDVCSLHKIEKIKSFGDTYMAACGLPEPRADHPEALTTAALDMLAAAATFNARQTTRIALQIGIHSGPVVAGIIGKRLATYDIWGDVVNSAQRMEAHGLPSRVQVSATTFSRINHRFSCEPREPISIKGKLPERAYLLRAALPVDGGAL